RSAMLHNLIAIADGLTPGGFLVGDSLSLADLAVAAQLSLLRFPASAGSQLAGRGVAGLSDHPRLQPLFEWRDQLEVRVFQPDPAPV
nr:glutathione S-transferase C-terminal domain-containing protein [Cyanobacteriota bacterium]